jgi:hypothetical protein
VILAMAELSRNKLRLEAISNFIASLSENEQNKLPKKLSELADKEHARNFFKKISKKNQTEVTEILTGKMLDLYNRFKNKEDLMNKSYHCLCCFLKEERTICETQVISNTQQKSSATSTEATINSNKITNNLIWQVKDQNNSYEYIDLVPKEFCIKALRAKEIKLDLSLKDRDYFRLLMKLSKVDQEIQDFNQWKNILLGFDYQKFKDKLEEHKRQLQEYLQKATNILQRNRSELNKAKFQKPKYQYMKFKLQYNINLLNEWVELTKSQIKENNLKPFVIRQLVFGDNSFEVINNKILPPLNIFEINHSTTQFEWIEFLAIDDYNKIIEAENKNILPKYIKALETRLTKTIDQDLYPLEISKHFRYIKEAIATYNNSHIAAAITLLLRENEGLVWEIAQYIVIKYNLKNIDLKNGLYYDNSNNITKIYSLYGLIIFIEWPKVFKANNTQVNFAQRLGYLTIDYRQERNSILHGSKTDFDTSEKYAELLFTCFDILKSFHEAK